MVQSAFGRWMVMYFSIEIWPVFVYNNIGILEIKNRFTNNVFINSIQKRKIFTVDSDKLQFSGCEVNEDILCECSCFII